METSTPSTMTLTEAYEGWVALTIDEKGIEIPHGLVLHSDGQLTVVALAVPPAEAYAVMLAQWSKPDVVEMIFAIDRYAKSGQGTTLGDLMAGHHFTREQSRPFIIEYQHQPRIVSAIIWDNAWWNAALEGELIATWHSRSRGAA